MDSQPDGVRFPSPSNVLISNGLAYLAHAARISLTKTKYIVKHLEYKKNVKRSMTL